MSVRVYFQLQSKTYRGEKLMLGEPTEMVNTGPKIQFDYIWDWIDVGG